MKLTRMALSKKKWGYLLWTGLGIMFLVALIFLWPQERPAKVSVPRQESGPGSYLLQQYNRGVEEMDESECIISGRVTDFYSKRPVSNLEVVYGVEQDVFSSSVELDRIYDRTKTDYDGNYCLKNKMVRAEATGMEGNYLIIGDGGSVFYDYIKYFDGSETWPVVVDKEIERILQSTTNEKLRTKARELLEAEIDHDYEFVWNNLHPDSKSLWAGKDEFIYYWSEKRRMEEEVMFSMVSESYIDEYVNFCPTVEEIGDWYSEINDMVYEKVYKFSIGRHVSDRTYRDDMYEEQYFELIDGEYYYIVSVSKDKIVEVVDNYDQDLVDKKNNQTLDYSDNSDEYERWRKQKSLIVEICGYKFNTEGWANVSHLGGDPTPYCEGD